MPAVEKRAEVCPSWKCSALPRILHRELTLIVSRLPQPFLPVDHKYQFCVIMLPFCSYLVLYLEASPKGTLFSAPLGTLIQELQKIPLTGFPRQFLLDVVKPPFDPIAFCCYQLGYSSLSMGHCRCLIWCFVVCWLLYLSAPCSLFFYFCLLNKLLNKCIHSKLKTWLSW